MALKRRSAMADLLELARRQRLDGLRQAAHQLRTGGAWTATSALELACAWLLFGDLHQADLAYVQADRLDPSLALVPDRWGLWPAASAPASADAAAVRAWAERYRGWRHADPQPLWQQLLPQLQAKWTAVLEADTADALLILGHASARSGALALDPPLEPELARLVADAEIAAEPAASHRFWQLVATIRPQWDLARIRAADLALARGELETSRRWLADPPAAALANPWFHDVSARHALASGAVDVALDAWAAAISTAQAETGGASSGPVEIFEQRRREARRGPGVLQVRSLTNRGDQAGALALLECLLAEDPQWQPLRSLREQLQPVTNAPAQLPQPPVADQRSDFSALLDRATARLHALGHPLPEPDATAAEDELPAWSRRLSEYEARFALA